MTDSNPPPPAAPESMWLEECARRTLIDQLGISPMVSRFDAVAAKPAERFAEPMVANLETPGDELSEVTEEMHGEQLRALLRVDVEERDGASADVTSPAQVAETCAEIEDRANKAVPNARAPNDAPVVMLMVTSQDILWVEVLEDQLLRTEQLQLIAAMARAVRGTAVRCAHQQFNWPPVGESAVKVAGGIEDMLSGFLQRLIGDHAIQHLVQLGTCEVLPNIDLQIHRTHSSLDMLRDGSLKQSAWSVLKQLRSGD